METKRYRTPGEYPERSVFNLQGCRTYLKLVFLTCVTKFGQITIFSGINQLKDVSINPKYEKICGVTKEEFHEVFKNINIIVPRRRIIAPVGQYSSGKSTHRPNGKT